MTRHIFNEQGGDVAVAIAVSWGGCNMFTDRGNARGRQQIAFESAPCVQLCNSQLYCPNINSSL